MSKSKGKERIVQRRAFLAFLYSKRQEKAQDGGQKWCCCDVTFDTMQDIARHATSAHSEDLKKLEATFATDDKVKTQAATFSHRRVEKGSSDPISFSCECEPGASRVILFYKYTAVMDPTLLAQTVHEQCTHWDLYGKVRIANEGINATVAGAAVNIEQLIDFLTIKRLGPAENGSDPAVRKAFFKPSMGCKHVFPNLSVKVVDEICPLGVKDLRIHDTSPKETISKLAPSDFHRLVRQAAENKEDYMILDARNYYESSIGHFQGAVLPPIRKFGALPEWIDRNCNTMRGKTVLMYCTGGIRCEKASAYLERSLSSSTPPDPQKTNDLATHVVMLEGGIHNYFEWLQSFPSTTHDRKEDEASDKPTSLFAGANYVFDARQSVDPPISYPSQKNTKTEVQAPHVNPSAIAHCRVCDAPTSHYEKCAQPGCCLLVLWCGCSLTAAKHGTSQSYVKDGRLYCCQTCAKRQDHVSGLCACEAQRRAKELKPIYILTGPPMPPIVY
ncbi:hypothetical protein BZG36_01910 [Bifiguratus adelaidae]|uniref:Rhodanese domain-containing protein n=1 Tax=Bifiguratus adelaidae TaxID=1938954 RepID=A0A261Y4G2_9FUNG|nr:hypothetical protein BZG36_01910 [Bifiguratus adelaidae]